MRIALAFVFMFLAFGGCSSKHDVSAEQQEMRFIDGSVLHFQKRVGSVLHGVELLLKNPPGPDERIEAPSGTITESGPHGEVKVVLTDAQGHPKGAAVVMVHELSLTFIK
jgi:hypothetical protein